jgi:hypothetical protein
VYVWSSSCGIHASGIKGFARCFISGRWGNKADVNLCDGCLTFESLTLTWAVLRWSIKALFCLRWKLGARGGVLTGRPCNEKTGRREWNVGNGFEFGT